MHPGGPCPDRTPDRHAPATQGRLSMTTILSVVGARPQFIKLAPLADRLGRDHRHIILHTGQHYDPAMSRLIFHQLGIPEPDHNLGVGSHPQGKQTGLMLEGIEGVLVKEHPDLVVVFGDTNSTIAGALAAVKLHIPVAHIEAGLRSFNRAMPEEINRILTDHCSDILYAPTDLAVGNLAAEGLTANVLKVGDIMYDAILRHRGAAERHSTVLGDLGLEPDSYSVLTLHRQENTDSEPNLAGIIEALAGSGERIVFPAHPRTLVYLDRYGLLDRVRGSNILLTDPVGYLDFLILMRHSRRILTDSGGVQKEAYFLKRPCITLRNETEWTETVEDGWNILVGADRDRILRALANFDPAGPTRDCYGDGNCAGKIAAHLAEVLGGRAG